MTNIHFEDPKDYKDVETLNWFRALEAEGKDPKDHLQAVYDIGRDNARTPIQWTDGKNAGFSDGEPWIKVNPNYPHINVEEWGEI